MIAVFDIETNGFLEVLDTLHSLVIQDYRTKDIHSFSDQEGYRPLSEGIQMLKDAELWVGHNILSFDLPALKKLGLLDYDPLDSKIEDTLVMSRLIYAHVEQVDWERRVAGMPLKLYGRHSLESWGHRLKFQKGDFGKQNGWDTWSKEMQDYCQQDVELNTLVYEKLLNNNYSTQAMELEHAFAAILEDQMSTGAPFNTEKAKKLADEVRPQAAELKAKLVDMVEPSKTYTTFVPKRNNKTLGYVKDVPIVKTTVTAFNPGSRPQIIRFLKKKYKWNPVDFTDKGNPSVDREVLEKLTDWEEVPLIINYLDMSKLLGMLETGKNSWLNFVKDGRIYGRIIHNGAITGRSTHFNPNLAQVPSVRSYRGREARELFEAPDGYRIVGGDAKSLELRMLGHYLYRYDDGTYAREVVEGDIHSVNQEAAGLSTRDEAKTFIYAVSYGAGDVKLGSIVEPQASEDRQRAIGTQLRSRFELRVPSIKQLVRDVKQKVKSTKKLKGLDGRYLFPRGQHMALNTLLQGAGAVVMKQATVILYNMVRDKKLDAKQILHVHDEYQYLVREDHAEELAILMCQAISLAGEQLKLNVPLEGDAKIGNNWAETH